MVSLRIDGYQEITTKPGPTAELGIEWDGEQDSGYAAKTLPLTRGGARQLRDMLDAALESEVGAIDDPLPGVIEPGATISDLEYDMASYCVDGVWITEDGVTQVRLSEGAEHTTVTKGDVIERFLAGELVFGTAGQL